MKHLWCLLWLFLAILPMVGCSEEISDVPADEPDPALSEEGDPSAEAGGQEIDPAL